MSTQCHFAFRLGGDPIGGVRVNLQRLPISRHQWLPEQQVVKFRETMQPGQGIDGCVWCFGHLFSRSFLQCSAPFPSAIQHPSYDDCLEVKREYYQNCSVLDCVTQCSQSAAHLYEQFLQVQQIGFWDPYAVHIEAVASCITVTWWIGSGGIQA